MAPDAAVPGSLAGFRLPKTKGRVDCRIACELIGFPPASTVRVAANTPLVKSFKALLA